jgi:signal transduction histidine kinase
MATLASATPPAGVESHRLRSWWTDDPRRMDRLAAGVLLLLAAVTVTGPGPELTTTGQAVAAAGSLVQAVSLLARRRAPVVVLAVTVAVLVVTAAVVGDPVAAEMGVAFAVYAVAAQRRPMVTWLAWAGTLLVSWLTYLAVVRAPAGPPVPTHTELLLTAMLGLLLVTLVALALGLTVRGRRVQVRALQERARQLVLERDQREQLAAAAERARMAREMHDVVAHSVAVMVTLAHGAAASLDSRPERSREALAELSGTGRAALGDMRRIVGLLRDDRYSGVSAATGTAELPEVPGLLDPAGSAGSDSVGALVETFQYAGLPVRLVERGPKLPHDRRLRHAVFRVVQESLTNVLRHAPRTTDVEVVLDRSEDHFTVTVANSRGPGGPDSSGGGHGLAGMRERVAAHRGTVEAGPTSTGWRVRVTLYYDEETS